MTDHQDPNFKELNLKEPDLKVPDCEISEPQIPAAKSQANENLANEDKDLLPKNAGIIYFPVGSTKFILMCLCIPFHCYEIWWLYKNIVCQKERTGKVLSPLWRINLPLLYLRNLLEAMRDEGKPYGLDKQLPIEKTILYWVMLIICLLCFPPPWSALGIFSFVPFIFVNKYLIKLNHAANPDFKPDIKFTPSNYLVVVVGGAYLALDIYVKYFMHI